MERVPYLNWGDSSHFDRTRDLPCCLCGRPTPLRSHDKEPVHKVCAEEWNATRPSEPRLYTPPDKKNPDRPQHDMGTWRFHNDGPTTAILSRPIGTATSPHREPGDDDGDLTLFAV